MSGTTEKLSFREKFCYGLGDASANIFMGFTLMFLTVYYTDVFKLDPAVMGTLFLISRFIDAVSDPLIGMISDRTKSKHGRYRSWLLYSAVPYGISCGILFLSPDLGETGRVIYAYVTYIFLILVYSCMLVPYVSLLGAISSDSNERLSINAIRFPLDKVAWLVCSAIVPGLLALFDNQVVGYRVVMSAIGFLCIVLVLLCYFNTKERVNIHVSNVSFGTQIKLLFKNDQALYMFATQISIMITNTLKFGAAAYFIKYVIENESSFALSSVLTAGSVAGIISPFISNYILQRGLVSRRFLMTTTQVFAGIFMLIIGLLHIDNVIILVGCVFISMIFNEMVSIMVWASVSDCSSYSLLKDKTNITGVISGGLLFATKLGMAIGGALLGYILAYFDYTPDAKSFTQEQLFGFTILFSYLPALFHILAAVFLRFYKLEADVCNDIQKQLEEQNIASIKD